MNKTEIKQALNVLTMVTGDCPFEREIGEEPEREDCYGEANCVGCWKKALSKELKLQQE